MIQLQGMARSVCDNDHVSSATTTDEVAAEIRRHVEALFDAFLAKDSVALREGRIEGWKGFQIPSTSLIRGVDRYMVDLESALENLSVTRYDSSRCVAVTPCCPVRRSPVLRATPPGREAFDDTC